MRETDHKMQLALAPGDKLLCDGREYRIEGVIGSGGNSIIYSANAGDYRKLAIKECVPNIPLRREGVLVAENRESRNTLSCFRSRQDEENARSQKIASATRRAIGVWEKLVPQSLIVDGNAYDNVDGVSYLLMERVDQMGMSFGDLVQNLKSEGGFMQIQTTIPLVLEILEALRCVHYAGYLHCDIQPNNIFFTDFDLGSNNYGTASLLDFGCARKLIGGCAQLLEDEEIFTTRGFTPPEFYSGTGVLKRSADIYSVGALLLRCVLSESMVRIGTTRLGRIDGRRIGCVGESLDALNLILKKALTTDPEKRYQNTLEMREDLQLLLDMVTPPVHLLPGVSQPGHFVGREDEIRKITRMLTEDHKQRVFVWGVGGYGKSEAAFVAAKQIPSVKGAYFVSFKGTMQETVLSLFTDLIAGETQKERFGRYLDRLVQEYRGAVLVIDNFYVHGKTCQELQKEEEYIAFINRCTGIKLIFTTRYPVRDGIEIGPLKDQEIRELMRYHLEDTEVSDEDQSALMEKTQGHTLLLILISRLINESVGRVTPMMILDALEKGSLGAFDRYALDANRITSEGRMDSEERLHGCLTELFKLYELRRFGIERHILRYATLLPRGGMNLCMFQDAIGCEQGVLKLVKMGLLIRRGNLIQIHDLIRTAARENLKPREGNCRAFLNALWKKFDPCEFREEYLQIAECLASAVEFLEPGAEIYDRPARIFDYMGRYEQAVSLLRNQLKLILQEGENINSSWLAILFNMIGNLEGKLGQFQCQRDSYLTSVFLLGGEAYGVEDTLPYTLDMSKIQMKKDLLTLSESYLGVAQSYERDVNGIHSQNIKRAYAYAQMALDTINEFGTIVLLDIHLKIYLLMARTSGELPQWDGIEVFLYDEERLINMTTDQYPLYRISKLCDIAEIYHVRKEFQKEIQIMKTVLALAKAFYGGDHPYLGKLYRITADALWEQGLWQEAVEHLSEAIRIKSSTLPRQSPLVADMQMRLSHMLEELGEIPAAWDACLEAAKAGSVKAMERLARCYSEGLLNCPVDAGESFYWLKKAADAGSIRAACMTGLFLLEGEGCEKDPVLAEFYLQKGTDAPPPFSGCCWCTLGRMYLGIHPDAPEHPIDIEKGIQYLYNAEDAGEDISGYVSF